VVVSSLKWTKVYTKFFLFDSEQAADFVFNGRPPVEMVDFHGEVTFTSVFDTFEEQIIK
jgi:hypothetical protein